MTVPVVVVDDGELNRELHRFLFDPPSDPALLRGKTVAICCTNGVEEVEIEFHDGDEADQKLFDALWKRGLISFDTRDRYSDDVIAHPRGLSTQDRARQRRHERREQRQPQGRIGGDVGQVDMGHVPRVRVRPCAG